MTYELWTDRKLECFAVVSHEGSYLDGSLPLGYLTKPPVIAFESDGTPSFQLGGNRRIAPNQHILTTADDELLATFATRLVAAPLDMRPRLILAPDGRELATLKAPSQGRWKRLRAALSGGYELTVGDKRCGFVDRSGIPSTKAPAASYRHARRLTVDADLDLRIAAGILVYIECVLEPSKSPG